MSLTTSIAIFFLIWWIVLFAVLPWGIRSQHEQSTMVEGTDPGAPTAPRLLVRLLWTTLVAAVIYVLFYANYEYGFITLDYLADLVNTPRSQ